MSERHECHSRRSTRLSPVDALFLRALKYLGKHLDIGFKDLGSCQCLI